MRGEIDAVRAAQELRAVPADPAQPQYVAWPEGQWPEELLRSKMTELAAVMENADRIEVRRFPFRREDFATRADAQLRVMLRTGVIWLGPLIVLLFAVTFTRAAFLPAPSSAFFVAWTVAFALVAFVLGLRGKRASRRHDLLCPFCRADLLGTKRFGGSAHLDVLETGACPQCRKQLIDPGEVDDRTA